MTSSTAYLDHAATTPMRPEAIEAMLGFFRDGFGNPSGVHGVARRARRALDDAREELAELLGCAPSELIFTSGGTESDNLAVLGIAHGRPGSVLVSAVEHRAVLAPATLVGAGLIPVDADGAVSLAALASHLTGPRGEAAASLVSVMLVNSETGLIQPIEEVRTVVAEHAPRAVVHTDAAQAFAWLDVAARCRDFDLVTISAHKFGGPKGIGALAVRERARPWLAPILHGGGQERELRAGTQNVPAIVAMTVAARYAAIDREGAVVRVAALRDRFVNRCIEALDAREPAPRSRRIAANAHLRFPGAAGEEVVLLLDDRGVAASTGSACASGAREPSHVLLAMGWDAREAGEAVRFTLGTTTTRAEIDHAAAATIEVVERLRSIA